MLFTTAGPRLYINTKILLHIEMEWILFQKHQHIFKEITSTDIVIIICSGLTFCFFLNFVFMHWTSSQKRINTLIKSTWYRYLPSCNKHHPVSRLGYQSLHCSSTGGFRFTYIFRWGSLNVCLWHLWPVVEILN